MKRLIHPYVVRKIRQNYSSDEKMIVNFLQKGDPEKGISLHAPLKGMRLWNFPPDKMPKYKIIYGYDKAGIRIIDIREVK